MKRAMVVRYGAYGDHVYITPVFKALQEDGYSVELECNTKGMQIHIHNPRISRLIPFEPFSKEVLEKRQNDPSYIDKRLSEYAKKYDKLVILQDTLETALIEGIQSYRYFWPLYMRREKNAHINYYDQGMMVAGYTGKKYMGWGGELWFPHEEHEVIGKFMAEKCADKFVVLWCLRGSMHQKAMFYWAREVIEEFCSKHKDALIITTGDETCQKYEWEHPQIIHKSGRWPFRQVALLAKYVDMVVTPETGLGVVAGAYGTPKIMLLTAASLQNVVANDKNDFSLQSPVHCSPCTRAIYDTKNCPVTGKINDLDGGFVPICVDFPKGMVLDRMEEARERAVEKGRVEFDPAKSGVYV